MTGNRSRAILPSVGDVIDDGLLVRKLIAVETVVMVTYERGGTKRTCTLKEWQELEASCKRS